MLIYWLSGSFRNVLLNECNFIIRHQPIKISFHLQSEQEKQLMRQVRKEERKEERRQARRDRSAASDEQDIDQESYLRSVGFDPESMKSQRYVIYFNPSPWCLF